MQQSDGLFSTVLVYIWLMHGSVSICNKQIHFRRCFTCSGKRAIYPEELCLAPLTNKQQRERHSHHFRMVFQVFLSHSHVAQILVYHYWKQTSTRYS
jgi:hypothetical protein